MSRFVLFCIPVYAILVTDGLAAREQDATSAAERDVRDMEQKWGQAVLKGDRDFFEHVLADDFTHTTQSGRLRNRNEWLANHQPGKSNYDALNADQLTVRVYGDTAVVTARITPRGRDSAGKPIRGQYRFLRVWVKQPQGAWKAVAFQSTRIAEEKEGTKK